MLSGNILTALTKISEILENASNLQKKGNKKKKRGSGGGGRG